jgi:hypothetical protein
MIVEVHTIVTSSLGNHHSNDDDNTYALDDGGEVQGDSDSHEPNRGPKHVGPSGPLTTRLIKANHKTMG